MAKKVQPSPSNNKPRQGVTTKDNNIIEDVEIILQDWCIDANFLRPGENIPIVVTIMNAGYDDITPDKCMLRVDADQFFKLTVKKITDTISGGGGEIKISFNLAVQSVQGINSLEKLPEWKEVYLLDVANKKKLARMLISIPIDYYFQYLNTFDPITVLLWGHFGTGKSSFVNTVHTVSNDNPHTWNSISTIAHTYAGASTNTIKWTHYPKFRNISIIDSPGYQQNDDFYDDLVIEAMLKGCLAGLQIKDIKDAEWSKIYSRKKVVPNVLALMLTTQAAEDDVYMSKVEKIIKKCERLNVPHLVLVTMIDKVDSKLKENPYANNVDVVNIQTKISNLTGIGGAWIQPMINYTSEPQRNWQFDRATFVSLFKLFQKNLEKTRKT